MASGEWENSHLRITFRFASEIFRPHLPLTTCHSPALAFLPALHRIQYALLAGEFFGLLLLINFILIQL